MYSAEEHEGIISEVIQDGYARVAEIENTRDLAILEAKKAQREFRYKAFVEASDMIEALSEMKQQTIVDMANRISQVEADAREKMRFDQEQADRNAFLLAPELTDATPEEIQRAALANGIEVGALVREIEAYNQEQEQYERDAEMHELDKEMVNQNILTAKHNRQMDWLEYEQSVTESLNAATEEELEEPLTANEIEKFKGIYNITPPPDWTRSDLGRFYSLYPQAPPEEVPALMEKYNESVKFYEANQRQYRW